MKKTVSVFLALVMLLGLISAACAENDDMKVAMVTDYNDITDQSFNQITYEACKAFCEANGIPFTYFKPIEYNTPERIAMIEKAIDEGFNTLVLPGYAFGESIVEVQDAYPDVNFIVLDVGESDLGGADLADNVFSAVYQEELSGYMAGYAAVKLGYRHLGFLGGMAVPSVIRFGYGFIQGADDAADELGVDAIIEYVYGNQFYGDGDITAYMDNWYQTLGVEAVFACGGGIYTSVAEAAAKANGKVIGVDVDQAPVIDGNYGEGMTLTSAMKALALTVETMLSEVLAGNFSEYGGKIVNLGMISGEDPGLNYVQLPASTRWSDTFTEDDYRKLVSDIFSGVVNVSGSSDVMPETVRTKVNDYGSIK